MLPFTRSQVAFILSHHHENDIIQSHFFYESKGKEKFLMAKIDDYNDAFKEAFEVEEGQLPELKYQDVAAWDSVGHMQMIALLEDKFDIMMDTDDIIDFSSYEKGKEILQKYDVNLNE
jgi:acyl carrier protein